jgi:hypothetical protein
MNTLTKLNSPGIPTTPKDAVAYWDNLASQFARGSVASQIMCGFAGIEWKKEMGFKHGGNRASADDSALGIRESVEAAFAFSYDTFRERVKMAEGVRADFKKLGLADRFKALLQTHPSEWSERDTKMISGALHKVTNGMSQADFFEKLGITTGAGRNNNPKPGKRGASDGKEKVDDILYIENDLVSIADPNDTTLGAHESVRLIQFNRAVKAVYDRVESILKARKLS